MADQRRVLDCILYNGERDMLVMRMEELRGLVYHIVIESSQTFSGHPKSLHWPEHLDPVHYYPLRDSLGPDAGAWQEEYFQRNCIMRGIRSLPHAGPLDPPLDPMTLVLISDADEIPSREAVLGIDNKLGRGVAVVQQQLSYYHLNQIAHDQTGVQEWWHGTKAIRLHELLSPQAVRDKSAAECEFIWARGGWHFSYCGGAAAIRHKIQSYAHQEFNDDKILGGCHIESCVVSGTDLFGRGYNYRTVKLDDPAYYWPRCVLEKPQRFAHLVAP